MDKSERLSLPYIMPAQAQKHVTHNEAVRHLDALVHLDVLGLEAIDPPASPSAGDCFVVGVNAAGEWLGQDGRIAAFQDSAWTYFEPRAGWRCFDRATKRLMAFDGTNWINVADQADAFDNLDHLGVNATADATNRLTVSSAASLFNHAGSDHRLTVNKAQPGDTASLLFQTNWQGRAEAGIAGDDVFRIKVSDDSANWHEGMAISPSDGRAAFPNGADFPSGSFTLSMGSHATGAYQGATAIAQQYASYTLVGNLCFCRCAFTPVVPSGVDLTTGSTLGLTGLPFAVKNFSGPVDQAISGSAYRSIGGGLNTLLGGYCSHQDNLFVFAFALASNNARNSDLHLLNFSYEIA